MISGCRALRRFRSTAALFAAHATGRCKLLASQSCRLRRRKEGWIHLWRSGGRSAFLSWRWRVMKRRVSVKTRLAASRVEISFSRLRHVSHIFYSSLPLKEKLKRYRLRRGCNVTRRNDLHLLTLITNYVIAVVVFINLFFYLLINKVITNISYKIYIQFIEFKIARWSSHQPYLSSKISLVNVTQFFWNEENCEN